MTKEVTHGHLDDHQRPVDRGGHSAVPAAGGSALLAVEGPTHTYSSQYERLKAIEAEYRMTIRVVAVLAERLLGKGDHELVLSDEALLDCPELIAWRDESMKQVKIRVRR